MEYHNLPQAATKIHKQMQQIKCNGAFAKLSIPELQWRIQMYADEIVAKLNGMLQETTSDFVSSYITSGGIFVMGYLRRDTPDRYDFHVLVTDHTTYFSLSD